MITCKECRYWDNRHVWLRYDFGICTSEKITANYHGLPITSDKLILESRGCEVGKDFGCIHGERPENIKLIHKIALDAYNNYNNSQEGYLCQPIEWCHEKIGKRPRDYCKNCNEDGKCEDCALHYYLSGKTQSGKNYIPCDWKDNS